MTIQFYNGKPQKIFNINQSNNKYVTFGDIEDVAYQSKSNYFYFYNFFANIQVAKINGIAGNILYFLENLGQNIQDFINQTIYTLTNISYSNNTTSILNNLETFDIESVNIKSNSISSNTININKINTSKIVSTAGIVDVLNCNTLKCNNLEFNNDIGLYLYLNNILIPLNKSILLNEINFNQTISQIQITIKPKYTIEFYNNSLLTFKMDNETKYIKHFIDVSNIEFTNIKIYFKNLLLV